MEKRELGQTGEMLSVIGFGGMVVNGVSQEDADRFVAEAVERGVNYFDVSPNYGDAEERLGPALRPYRDSAFLACKTEHRNAEGAQADLQNSLKRLETDYVDLYQFHSVTTADDVARIMAPGGAMETFAAARKSGVIRHIGLSVHSEEAALLMMARFGFDSVLFPLNYACWHKGDFGPRILSKARAQGIGVLALKALAKRPWLEDEPHKWSKCWYAPIDEPEEADLAVRFTLSQPVTAAVSSSHVELLWLACDAAERFTPMPDDEQRVIMQRLDGEPVFTSGQ
jgi:aryl-alcohol dehydrogenase-like predicted oxidoreductase